MKVLPTAVVLVLVGTSCTGSRTEHTPPSPAGSPTGVASSSAQPVTDYSSFTHALAASGFTVREGPRTTGDPFAVPNHSVFIDGFRLSTYEYPSPKALEDVRASISQDGYTVPTRTGAIAMVEWVATPHFYAADKLLVLDLGGRPRILQALDRLLGAQFAGG